MDLQMFKQKLEEILKTQDVLLNRIESLEEKMKEMRVYIERLEDKE